MKHPHRLLLVVTSLILLLTFAISTLAKDEWLQVRSKNFFLVGNASEKDIRKVGIKLEQFRETFRLVFANTSLVSTIPTNVIVFKSDSAFKPFKPRRADGKADNFIAGYFQPGEDANYITISAEGDDTQMYSTIFHEYVHFLVNTNFPKSEVPQWFNEGLAEYYSTFAIENDQIAKLGLPDSNHLYLLKQTKLMPLEQLLKVSNRQLHAQGDHSRSIFYAESWALVHYLIQTGKDAKLSKFLLAVVNRTPQDKAFQDAFQITYAQMESELKKYVSKNSYQYHNITFKNKLDFDTGMQTAPYSEAETNARLGDLLYHTNRADDAEPFLAAALKLDPNMSVANTTLGMVKMRQRKFDEAKQYLEKATAGDQKNPLAFYQYAYLLSREGSDEFGYARSFSKGTVEKMRTALKWAIAIAPDFGATYELLAFISLVNNDEVDEAVALLKTALKYQPGNERYTMRIAELYARQGKFDDATAIASKFAQSDDDELRSRAESLAAEIQSRKKFEQQIAGLKRRTEAPINESSSGPVTSTAVLRKREPIDKLTEEQLAELTEEANIRSINEALRQTKDGEKRVIGYVEKIECKGRDISYLIKTADRSVTFTSKDFQTLEISSFAANASDISIGCNANLSGLNVVITFKEASAAKPALRSELVSLEFVPKTFRLMSKAELSVPLKSGISPDATVGVIEQPPTSVPPSGSTIISTSMNQGPPADFEKMRREAILQNIKSAIREPAPGEKREIAFLQKVECTNKGVYFNMKTGSTVLRLFDPKPDALAIRVFAPDLGGVRLECNASILDFPAVVIYADSPDKKLKSSGTIISLDFVPKSFTLD
jgi:tetratricopeptide (TPR) repeat protein